MGESGEEGKQPARVRRETNAAAEVKSIANKLGMLMDV